MEHTVKAIRIPRQKQDNVLLGPLLDFFLKKATTIRIPMKLQQKPGLQ